MNNYEFTINGARYVRVSKSAAIKTWKNNDTVVFCPCKLRPGYPWHPEYVFPPDVCPAWIRTEKEFCEIANAYSVYNCNSNETGRYIAYYVKA